MNSVERRARVMAWAMVIVTAPGLIVNPATAATYWWDGGAGGGGNLDWSNNVNWSDAYSGGNNPSDYPGQGGTTDSVVKFYASGANLGAAIIVTANGAINSLEVLSTASTPFGVGWSSTLTIGSGGITINSGAGAFRLTCGITLGASQTWRNDSASTFTRDTTAMSNGGYTLTIAGSGTTTISADISGAGGITKTGSGTWNATYAPGTDQGYSFTGSVVVEGGNVETTTTSFVGTFKNASSVTIGGGAIAAQLKVSSLAGLFYATRKTVTLKTNGKLTMSNNNTAHLFDLTFEGGELASGTGRYSTSPSWQLNGDITVTANTGVSTMSAHWMGFNQSYLPNSGDSDITFNVGANSTLNVTGVLENGYSWTDTKPFIKAGDGLMILAPNNGEPGTSNTYTSPTKITGGVLRLSQQNAIPGGIGSAGGTKKIELAGGVVEMNFDDFKRSVGTGNTQVQFTGDGGFSACGAPRIVNLGGSLTPSGVTWTSGSFVPNGNKLLLSSTVANATVDFQNPIDLNGAARTVDVRDGSAAVDAKLTGVLSGSGSSGLNKTGAGTLELAASVTHTYAGATTVSAGTLLVNGTLDVQSSAVTVSGTGTLGGAGTINRPVTINSGGTLAPGNSVGTLTIVDTLGLAGGGTLQFEINNATGSAGTNWDLLTGSTLNITATSVSKFTINVVGLTAANVKGAVPSFTSTGTYKWKILDTDAEITGFVADKFAIEHAMDFDPYNSNSGTWAIKRGDQVTGGDYTQLWLIYYDPPGTMFLFK